ncbi:helix-turn-helix domain-containing protein [Streptomyces pseudovenezuelae]|uniref:helix-turn-helix domain-containing protein n=1 Tax=Streptomyces pseudovenezuelae TaxID=67350 RepID=UPI0036E87162
MHTIVLKVDEFVALAASRGHTTYEQQAEATGLGQGTMHRIRNGEPVSSTTIAAICSTYGADFDALFTFGMVKPKHVPPVPSVRPVRRMRAAAA